MLEKLLKISAAMNHRFPDGNQPFQIMTRLLEESGELAQMVNHFEGCGVKREKYGVPNKEKLAKEVKDVLLCALQVTLLYGIEHELEESLELSYQRLKAEGHLTET